jgi:glyoxylase-like metal-dependent hydrolase (beta-lactamase superfamily II)
VGAWRWELVRDGTDLFPPGILVCAGVPDEEAGPALAGVVDDNGLISFPYGCLLARGEGEVVLADSGTGTLGPGRGGGHLEDALARAGVTAEEVTVVVLTHLHVDHIGGVVADGKPRFPNARHVVTATEWSFWTSGAAVGRAPDVMLAAIDQVLPVLSDAGVVELVDDDAELAPGLRLVPAPGHAPGQVAVELEGDDGVLFLADAVIHPLHFARLDWGTAGDSDSPQMRETRQRLLGRAADEGLRVTASHLWGPGRVERDGAAFRFLPDE